MVVSRRLLRVLGVARGFIQLWADYSVNSPPRILSTGKRGCVQPRQLVPSTVHRRRERVVLCGGRKRAATGSVRGGGVIWGTGRPGSKTAESTKQCMELGERHYDAGGIYGPLF